MVKTMRIAIVSDKSGFPLKEAVAEYLRTRDDVDLTDFGIPNEEEAQPYDVQAPKVAKAIQSGEADRGIAICGTGQGMAIVANKHKGVYAVVADSLFAAQRGRVINNSNVLTMGGWITAPFLGIEIVKSWLELAFTELMPDRAEWLRSAFERVQTIESDQFK